MFSTKIFIAFVILSASMIVHAFNMYGSRIHRKTFQLYESEKKEVVGKADLISQIKETTGFTKQGIEAILEALTTTIKQEVLVNGKEVRIKDLGTFKLRETAARTGRNPKTGEEILIKAAKSVTFTASSALKSKEE